MDDGKESEKSNSNYKDGLSNIGEIIKTDARATFSNPIVIIVLIVNFLFGNGLMFPLPKRFSKFLKRIKENE